MKYSSRKGTESKRKLIEKSENIGQMMKWGNNRKGLRLGRV